MGVPVARDPEHQLGWRGPRPHPGLGYAFGAGAGAFLVLAVMRVADELGDGIGFPIVGSLVLVLAALVVTVAGIRGTVESAAATMLAIAFPLFVALVVIGDELPSRDEVKV